MFSNSLKIIEYGVSNKNTRMEVEIQSTYLRHQTPKAGPVTTPPSKEQSKRSQKRKAVKLHDSINL